MWRIQFFNLGAILKGAFRKSVMCVEYYTREKNSERKQVWQKFNTNGSNDSRITQSHYSKRTRNWWWCFVYCLVFVLHTFVCESTVARVFNMAVFLVYIEIPNWLSWYAGNCVSFSFSFLNLKYCLWEYPYVEAMLIFVFLQKFAVIILQTVKSWLQRLLLDRLVAVKCVCEKAPS